MRAIRLSQRLWAEHVHQVRSLAATRVAGRRRERVERLRVEELVRFHLPRVRKIARQVLGKMPHLDLTDLVQTGVVGLLQADTGYHPEDGEFEAFSYFRIYGAMIDAHKRRSYRDETHESIDAIQERLGYLPAKIATDPAPLPDELLASREEDSSPAAALKAAASGIFAAVWNLPIRHQRVMLLRYQMDLSTEETGRRLGVSPSQIRILHGEALAMLRPAAETLQ